MWQSILKFGNEKSWWEVVGRQESQEEWSFLIYRDETHLETLYDEDRKYLKNDSLIIDDWQAVLQILANRCFWKNPTLHVLPDFKDSLMAFVKTKAGPDRYRMWSNQLNNDDLLDDRNQRVQHAKRARAERQITTEDIESLLEWQDRFAILHGKFVNEWVAGGLMPYPKYPQLVVDFFMGLYDTKWIDKDYAMKSPEGKIDDPDFIDQANIDEIKVMLTYAQRGEKFCDGHWGYILSSGKIDLIFDRLKAIRVEME